MLPPSRPPVALLAAVALVLAIPAGAQCSQGAWEAPFDHEFNTAKTNQVTPPRTATWPSTFNAVHMSLIPVGPYRGQVLVWDKAEVQLEPWQRWSIIDPEWTPSSSGPLFRNHFLLLPSQDGDLFCAGHVWGQDGRLFVAGGTLQYPSGGSNYLGGLLVYQFAPDLYDPNIQDHGLWVRQPDLTTPRWYPGVTMLEDGKTFLITGGTDNRNPVNSYEAYQTQPYAAAPASTYQQRTQGFGDRRLYSGPGWPTTGFSDYPRHVLLNDGSVFASGWSRHSYRWTHDPAQNPGYDTSTGQAQPGRSVSVPYNMALLDPRSGGGIDNTVLRMGGIANGTVIDTTQTTVGDQWGLWVDATGSQRMTHARWMANAVILPTGEVFVVGGFSDAAAPYTPVMTPELLTSTGWQDMAPHVSERGYHSTAVLLPDGRVFVGGADQRTEDYEIWKPPYLTCGKPRPRGVGGAWRDVEGGLEYRDAAPDELYTVFWDEDFPDEIARIVLIRPGSVTHHSPMDTRYVELEMVEVAEAPPPVAQARFRAPPSPAHVPPGWYMLFLVSDQGVPSEAEWVHLK